MPALVVEVVGDTTKLTKDLAKAETQVKGFARTIATTRQRGDPMAQTRKMLAELDASIESGRQFQSTMRDVDDAAVSSGASIGELGLKAGVAAFAVNRLGQNLSQAGGGLGKFGSAMSALTTGDFVGFAKAAQDNTKEVKGLEASLLKTRDALKAGKLAAQLAAIGWDDYADAALRASKALQQVNDQFVDPTKIHDPTSPGAIAAALPTTPKPPPKPKPLTAEQRRAFFDARIGRAIDRTQDLKSVQAQVAALRKVAAEIQKRIDATSDRTRQLNLEDQLVAVNRRAQALLDQQSSDAAAEEARAGRQREQEARAAAEQARRVAQARRDHLAAMKEAAEVARQTHLEWLEFSLERAETTKTIKDDVKSENAIIRFYKQRIRVEGRKLELVRELWRHQQAVRDLHRKRQQTVAATAAASSAAAAPAARAAAAAPRLSKLEALNRFADLRQFGGNMWSRAGAATVVVNQHFNAPTTDRHREARYAMVATRSVFDG